MQSTFLPFLRSTDPETKLKEYEAVGPAVAGVDSALAWGDQYGTMGDFEGGAGENAVAGESPCTTYLTDPTVPLWGQGRLVRRLAQLLVSIFSGTSPTTPLADSPVPERLGQLRSWRRSDESDSAAARPVHAFEVKVWQASPDRELLYLLLIIGGLLVAADILGNLSGSKPWISYTKYRVAFADVKGVIPGSTTVRIAGVDVQGTSEPRRSSAAGPC